MAEMGKTDAPTLFQVNGPVGLANWKDYCYDLSGSDIYSQLTSDDYALKEGDTVYGIALRHREPTASSPTRPCWRRPATPLRTSRALRI